MNIIEKTSKSLSIVACCLIANLAYPQQTANDCVEQFSSNMAALDEYQMQKYVDATPFFGADNQAGFGDLGDFAGLLATAGTRNASTVGLGAVYDIMGGMLDQLDTYWDLIGEADEGYNQALDILGSTFDDCWAEATKGSDYN